MASAMPATRASTPQTENRVLGLSGSNWGAPQLKHFNIAHNDFDFDYMFQLYQNVDLERETLEQLKRVNAGFFWTRTFRDLMKPNGAMLGPFFSTMARIKEDPSQRLAQRSSRRVTAQKVKFTALDGEADENGKGKRRASAASYHPSDQGTDMSLHIDRVKKEIITQMAIHLFGLSVFEGSTLPSRQVASDPKAPNRSWRLEWDVAGFAFEIESFKVRCTCINDGGLIPKLFSVTDHWVEDEKDSLRYCSVETKARLTDWEDGVLGEPSDRVHAQEASQLIGMLCQRLRRAIEIKGDNLDPEELSDYDRTVFLVSAAQRSMFLKSATFSPEYIRYFFPRLLRAPSDPNDSDDSDESDVDEVTKALRKVKVADSENNKRLDLNIGISREFDLSREDVVNAARLLLHMGNYLESNGPLLKGIQTRHAA
ncbi:hypothetical protein FQN50_009913 [Emmonsiellopsis sp. PD_5]|nr:hypothetical protein FQN50_009913 [Emmonsiellopsis sp. PD_5]